MLPGPERNAEDDWRLNHGFVSKVGILQERQDLTEDEAFETLRKVAEQNAKLQAMGVDPTAGMPMMGALQGLYSGEGPRQGMAAAQGKAAMDGEQGGAPYSEAPDAGDLTSGQPFAV
jgi:hypothetical protein